MTHGDVLAKPAFDSGLVIGIASVAVQDGPPRNHLLRALTAAALADVQPYLVRVVIEERSTLFDPGSAIEHLYFPETMVVSLISALANGGLVEVGTVGCEGAVGLPVFLDGGRSSMHAIAQIGGRALRIEADRFRELAGAPGALQQLMLRYTQAYLIQLAQTAACNNAHLVQERCARWLLMTHDRVHEDEFELAHEFLAMMLGVGRSGVTIAIRSLQDAGLVGYSRGRVVIADRAGLERASCECYQIVRSYFEHTLSQRFE